LKSNKSKLYNKLKEEEYEDDRKKEEEEKGEVVRVEEVKDESEKFVEIDE